MSPGLRSIYVDFILCGPNKNVEVVKERKLTKLCYEDAFQNRPLIFEMQSDVPKGRKSVQCPGQTGEGSAR